MSDLTTRLREHVDTAAPPIDIESLVDELQQEPGLTTVQPGRRWIPNWAYAFAAAVAVLVVIGGVALLFNAAEPTDAVDRPVTPSTLAESAAESAVPGPWTTHRIDGGFPEVSGVARFGSIFVAVGQTAPETPQDVWGRGQIWTSDDGTSWSPVRWNGTLFEHGHFALGAVANDSEGIVWGVNNRQGGTVILASENGADWELVTDSQPPVDHGASFTNGIALTSGGYVLYGAPPNCYPETGDCFTVEAPRLLSSADGISWDLVATPVTFTAIAESDSGELLAVGGSISEPTTWISVDDGHTWQAYGPDRSIDGGRSAEVSILKSTPRGWIAAGLDAEGRPMMWFSTDGQTFSPTLELPAGPEPNQYGVVEGIAFGDGWVVAVGVSGIDQPLMLASIDGKEWESVPLEGTYQGGGGLIDVVYSDGVFVAAGNHGYTSSDFGRPLILRWDTSTTSP